MTDQSSEDPTQTGELGPMPDAAIEPGETSPGGVDAIPGPAQVVSADLDPDKNPAGAASPGDVKESLSGGEDTETEATKGSGDTADTDSDDGEVDPKDESPA